MQMLESSAHGQAKRIRQRPVGQEDGSCLRLGYYNRGYLYLDVASLYGSQPSERSRKQQES